jgi:hypothetical protein
MERSISFFVSLTPCRGHCQHPSKTFLFGLSESKGYETSERDSLSKYHSKKFDSPSPILNQLIEKLMIGLDQIALNVAVVQLQYIIGGASDVNNIIIIIYVHKNVFVSLRVRSTPQFYVRECARFTVR